MKTTLTLVNPAPRPILEGASMYEDDYDNHGYERVSRRAARRARRNPSGAQALEAGAHTFARVIAGATATFVGKKLLAMRKPDGTARLSPKAQLAIQGGVAFAAAVGASMVDNEMAGDVLGGTAAVMGGDAALQAVTMYGLDARVQSLIPGQQAAAPQLGAGTTNPGGWVGYTGVSAPYYAS